MNNTEKLDECLKLINNIEKMEKIENYLKSLNNNGRFFQLLIQTNHYKTDSLNLITENIKSVVNFHQLIKIIKYEKK